MANPKQGATGAQNTGNPNGTTSSTGTPPDIISMFQDRGENMESGDPIDSELPGAGADTDAKSAKPATPDAGTAIPPLSEGDQARADMEQRIKALEAENAALKGRSNEPVSQDNLAGHGLAEEKSIDDIQTYVRWLMEPVTKEMNIIGQGVKAVLLGYKPVRSLGTTEVPARIAMVLNAQTPNNMHHYFLEGQEKFVDAENYF